MIVLGPRRRRAALAAALVVLVAIVVVVVRRSDAACGAETISQAGPLQSVAKMHQQPDQNRDRLATAMRVMGPPFGPVRAGVAYYYQQWLHLYGVNGGLLAWTKDNAPVSFLDSSSLTARWSLRPTSPRTAWDASANKFLLLDLSPARTTVAEFDLRTGRPGWCVQVADHQAAGQPVATAFLDDGDVIAALPHGNQIALTRLAAGDGEQRWSRRIATAARADYLGTLPDGRILVGGVEGYRLAAAPPTGPAERVLTAVDPGTGRTAWTWSGGAGTTSHVVGVSAEGAVVAVRSAPGTDLVGLDASGSQVWRIRVPGAPYESTMRGEVVLTRSVHSLDAYDVRTGGALWHRRIPTDRTYFPYGFTLDQMPSLDAEHLLMPTTSSLEILDLRNGHSRTFALPTDGLSTTYWPYQLVVNAEVIGVLSNSGAVLSSRE